MGFLVSPTFKLPASPRSFVYEQLIEGVTVKCKNSSNGAMNKLRRKLSEAWQALDDRTVWQAVVDAAGMSPTVSASELGRSDVIELAGFSGTIALSELRLSFGELDHEGDMQMWCGSKEDGGDNLLMHMLDALVWK